MEGFLMTHAFSDLEDLNRQFARWRAERNGQLHTLTESAADVAFSRSSSLFPHCPSGPTEARSGAIGATGFVQIRTPSLLRPSSYANRLCSLLIIPIRSRSSWTARSAPRTGARS